MQMLNDQQILDFVKRRMKPEPKDRISKVDLEQALLSRISVLEPQYDLAVDLLELYGGCHPEDEEYLLSVLAQEHGLEHGPEAQSCNS